MPIDVIGGSEKKVKIDFRSGRISSTQNYRGRDPDVSDIAMDFYSLIYNINENLVQNRRLVNTDFCGDTITSYKTLKKKIDINQKTDEQLRDITHCLANFWLLPMDVGHSSSWTAKRHLMHLSKSVKCKDWMPSFLKYYFENINLYKEAFATYTEKFSSEEEEYKKQHYLIGIDEKKIKSIKDYTDMYDIRINNMIKSKGNKIIEMIKNQKYEVIR